MSVLPSVQAAVDKTVAAANAKVVGTDLLKNDPEALLLMAVTKAFGDEPSGFVYVSPRRARSTKRIRHCTVTP